MRVLFAALLSALGSALLLWLLLRSGWASKLATDQPNQRSLHIRVTPRVGGWGIVGGGSLAIVWLGAMPAWAWPVLILVVVSFIDDRRGLSSALRFTTHTLAAALFVVLSGVGLVAGALVIVLVVWMTNLFNFMDGSDGLAGGMAVCGFSTYALAALASGDVELAGWAAAITGGAIGFLLFNLHPARVFMGDAGSIPLGFLAAALGLQGWLRGDWPVWFPAVVFAPFITDATVTLLRRALRGERFWQAHREHFYQRLVRSGFGHARTAWVGYALMALCAAFALAGRILAGAWGGALAIGLAALSLVITGFWISRRWHSSVAEGQGIQ